MISLFKAIMKFYIIKLNIKLSARTLHDICGA